MVLEQKYTRAAPALANYSYTDLDEGTGFVLYYAMEGTDENLLRKTATYSNSVVQFYSEGTYDGTFKKRIDIDYDVEFNTSKTMEGRAIITVTGGCYTKVAETNSLYVIAKLRKWDGATETEIATNTSDTYTTGSTINTTYSKTFCVEIDTPQTVFKSGESLRLTIELWVRLGSGAGNADLGS